MPIYMDRHDVSEMVTAENVAHLHQQDLKIQDNYSCKGLTYWFDENRKTAFCLIEAPGIQNIVDMHNNAHGEIPHQVIEVDANVVESFLGRIEDPEQALHGGLNIINDPAFRTIIVAGMAKTSFKNLSGSEGPNMRRCMESLIEVFNNFNGRVAGQSEDRVIVSFESVSQAVWCAKEAHAKFKEWVGQPGYENIKLKMGISAGVPVTDKKAFFEDTIKTAERMFYISEEKIVVSPEIKKLYKAENLDGFVDQDLFLALAPSDEKFLNLFMDYIAETWKNADLHVDDFGKDLGYSKSQLYRKMISLTGMSLVNFIRDFRLNKALHLIKEQTHTISEIAYETGFNSPSYFTRCFLKKYGLLPSQFQHLVSE
jgi:AraC-like DNA-binding protein